MNKQNLLKLAKFLENLPQKRFDIGRWSNGNGGDSEMIEAENPEGICGTVACAVGWCPILFKDEYVAMVSELDDVERGYCFPFRDFSTKLFLLDTNDWMWCFGADWKHTDNTPEGAARRIRWLVSGKALPKWWKGPYSLVDELAYMTDEEGQRLVDEEQNDDN